MQPKRLPSIRAVKKTPHEDLQEHVVGNLMPYWNDPRNDPVHIQARNFFSILPAEAPESHLLATCKRSTRIKGRRISSNFPRFLEQIPFSWTSFVHLSVTLLRQPWLWLQQYQSISGLSYALAHTPSMPFSSLQGWFQDVGPADKRRRNFVTTSLLGWAQT